METAYERAVCADLLNAEILRQFVCYSDEYRSRGVAFDDKAECLLCVGGEECEICTLKSTWHELQDVLQGGEPYRLDDLASHLLSSSNIERLIAEEASTEEGRTTDAVKTTKTANALPVLLKLKLKHRHSRKKKPVGTANG